jgi:hypothetical protein
MRNTSPIVVAIGQTGCAKAEAQAGRRRCTGPSVVRLKKRPPPLSIRAKHPLYKCNQGLK